MVEMGVLDEPNEEEIQILHVGMSRNLIEGLPSFVESPDLPGLVRIACLESYFVNLRLLIEFLSPKESMLDFSAKDFVAEFKAEEIAGADETWQQVSKNIVHFSRIRSNSEQLATTLDTTENGLREIAAPVMAELVRFEEELFHVNQALAELLKLPYF